MRILVASSLVAWILLALGAGPAFAGELPRAAPAEVGLDGEALAKIDAKVAAMIEGREFPGASVAVARDGKVAYLKSFGDFKDGSLVRIYSMTKPITVVAALILVEEGKLALADPVSKYLPGFDKLAVEGSDRPPAPMTIKHLMQHTSGLTYGLFGDTPVDRAYREQDVLSTDTTLEQMVAKLARIPLLFEPGARWHYSVAIDVLGRVIEVAAKQPLDAFLAGRIFKPLGMDDTSFSVPDAQLPRFVPCCGPRGRVIEAPETSRFRLPPALLSGGGGLVSTLSDYLAFALMLDAGGTWNGKRILKPETVQQMTTNQLPEALLPIGFGPLKLGGLGFGLGVSVRVKAMGEGTAEGEWGWAGAASTTFYVSPKDRLVVVTMVQRMPMWNGLDAAVRPLVRAALRAPASAVGR